MTGSTGTGNVFFPHGDDCPAEHDIGLNAPAMHDSVDAADSWYDACERVALYLGGFVPPPYRSRTFTGIIGDIKALSPRKASSLIGRKKGLGVRYAELYLSQGIDRGRGYQACASEALHHIIGDFPGDIIGGRVLDVGCAVGVTAGVLGLDHVTGFDLFPDLLRAGRMTDRLLGRNNSYTAADMTHPWPFRNDSFDTVVCGLVCHHLKNQRDISFFFRSASESLRFGGRMVVTLPAGSVSNPEKLEIITRAVEGCGFQRLADHCGMAFSTDDPRSLFWMFLLVFVKTGPFIEKPFVHADFGFPDFRTLETRVEKGEKVRNTGSKKRLVRHDAFGFFTLEKLMEKAGGRDLVYDTVRVLAEHVPANIPAP